MPTEQIYPVYFLKGREAVLRTAALDALIDQLTDPGFRDFDVERIDGKDATADRILAAAGGAPFASLRRVVVVEDAQRMASEEAERLQKLLPKNVNPASAVVFVAGETGEAKKGSDDGATKTNQRAAAVVRRLDTLAKSLGVIRKFDPLKPPEAARWLAEATRHIGKAMDTAARTELLARVGPALGALQMELEKLAAFAGTRPAITVDDVRSVVSESTEFTIFNLTDAVGAGNVAAALRALHGLRANNEPALRILPMLTRQYRLVWQAKMMSEDRSAADRLPKDLNLLSQSDWQREKFARQARTMTWERLRRGLRLMLQTDLALKGVEGPAPDEDEALEKLVVELGRR